MSSIQSLTRPTHPDLAAQWSSGCRAIAQGKVWMISLIAVGSLSNLVYTCTLPFVCLGVIAGTTLPRRRAIASVTGIWFANQLCGYTLHNYPQTLSCFIWGWILFAGTLLVTMMASYKPLFSQGMVTHHYLRMVGLLVGGFVLFQLVIFGAGFAMQENSSLTPSTLGGILGGNAGWLVTLAIAHGVLVWDKLTRKAHSQIR